MNGVYRWLSAGALFVLGVQTYWDVLQAEHPAFTLALAVVLGQSLLIWARVRADAAWVLSLGLCLVLMTSADGPAPAIGLCQLALLNFVSVYDRRRAVGAALATYAAICLVLAVQGSFAFFSLQSVTLAVWTAGAAGIGAAIRSRRQYVEAVVERARWAMETREAEARRRVAEERLRIARDLHDILGHHVAVIRLHTGLARRSLKASPERTEEALRAAESATQSVLREMSSMLKVLREPDLEDSPAPAPGLGDVQHLVENLRLGGMDVVLTCTGDLTGVPDLTGLTAYRVVQELLTNARRHGRGRSRFDLDVTADRLVLRSSNPVSERPVDVVEGQTLGYGLVGMRERVQAVGGRIRIDDDDASFRVTVELPVTPAGEENPVT